MSTVFIGIPGKKGPRNSRRFAAVLPTKTNSPFLVPTATTSLAAIFSPSGNGRQDCDQIPRRERRVEALALADVVVVDKDIDVRPRLAALVADAHVHLRM